MDPDENPSAVRDEQPPQVTRHERTWRDMVWSMLAILVPIALFLLFYRSFLGGEQPVEIDPAPAIADARASGAFTVLAPTGLDDDWRPTAASFRTVDGGKSLRIGYVTPSDGSVLLVESTVPTETLLPAELTDTARPIGTVTVDGVTWQSYAAREKETALVLLDPTRTVVIVGTGTADELRELADSLQ